MTVRAPVRIETLGGLRILNREGDPIKLSRKTGALLAFLIAADQPSGRHRLSELFCSEAADPAGSLRWHLSRIRKSVPNLLGETRDPVRVQTAGIWDDRARFDSACIDGDYRLAVDLYQGDYLAGLSLGDAPEFEVWLLTERSRLRQQYESALAALLDHQIEERDFPGAIESCTQLLQSNPLLESAHLRLIWLYATSGRRQDALTQFEFCRELLHQELAVDPSPELLNLIERVRADDLEEQPVVRRERLEPSEGHRQGRMALVGREAELDLLHRARDEGSSVVLVSGVAGGGKSSLIQAFAAQPSGMGTRSSSPQLIMGNCYESTRNLPYHPWIDMLQKKLESLRPSERSRFPDHLRRPLSLLLPSLGRYSSDRPALELGQQEQLFLAIAEFLLLRPSDSDQPAPILFLDDLQWSDGISLQLFHFVARRVAQSSDQVGLLIGAFRSEELEDNPGLPILLADLNRTVPLRRIDVTPLGEEEVDSLVAELWPELPPGYRDPYVRNRLLQETGGNPLYLTEILNELAGASSLPSTMPVPPSLQVLIQRRLRQLPESGRQVIEALAILDLPGRFSDLRRISGRSGDETETALEIGLRRRLLQMKPDSGRIDFVHERMREVVLSEMGPIRRQRLHRRTANLLDEVGAPPATLAYHWRMAGATEEEGLAALAAADAAAQSFAHEEATEYYRRALICLPQPRLRSRALLGLGDVWSLVGRWDEAESLFEECRQLASSAGEPDRYAAALAAQGRLLLARGQYEQAITTLSETEPLLDPASQQTLLLSLVGDRGTACWRLGNYDEAEGHFVRQLELAQAAPSDQSASDALRGLGLLRWSTGNFDEALEFFQRSLTLARSSGHLRNISRTLGNLGIIYAEQGDFVRTLEEWSESLRINQEIQDLVATQRTLGNIGRLYHLQGRFDLAQAHIERQAQISIEIGDWQGVSVALGNLANLFSIQGEIDIAETLVERAVALGRWLATPYTLCDFLGIEAEVRELQGRHREAQDLAAESITLGQEAERREIVIFSTMVKIRAQIAADPQSLNAGLEEAATLLRDAQEPEFQARILFEIWKLKPQNDEARRKAIHIYSRLSADRDQREFAENLAELTGEPLPPRRKLPAILPPEVDNPLSLEEILARVDEYLIEIATASA